MRRDVAASPRRGSHRLSLLTVPRAASREAHCQADRGINLSAVESRKLVDRKYCFIAIGDLFTEKISHARIFAGSMIFPGMPTIIGSKRYVSRLFQNYRQVPLSSNQYLPNCQYIINYLLQCLLPHKQSLITLLPYN